jgi:hypothetical protein
MIAFVLFVIAFSSLLNSPDSKFQLGVDYQKGETGNEERARKHQQDEGREAQPLSCWHHRECECDE